MRKQIEDLEKLVAELKVKLAEKERQDYESKQHVNFEIGDIVTNGNHIGVVAWTKNTTSFECSEDKGYMGIDLINGCRGFLGFAKRDDYKKVEDPYYLKSHKIEFELTGVEIECLLYYLRPGYSKEKEKTIKILESFKK